MSDGYRSLFSTYISQSVETTLECVLDTHEVLASDDREDAWHILSFSLDAPETWPNTQKLLLTLAPRMEQDGFRSEWIPYMQKGIRQSQLLNDRLAEAELSLLLGYLYLLNGEFDTASNLLEASMAIFTDQKDVAGYARSLNRLALLRRRESRYTEALEFAQQALNLLESTDPECANSFVVQSEVLSAENRWAEAEVYYRKALQLWEDAGDTRRVIWGLRNLGASLQKQGKYAEADDYYKRAITLLEHIHDSITLATVKMNLGTLYYAWQQYHKALQLYFSAESVFHRAEDRVHLAMIYNNMGMSHRALQEWSPAIDAFEKSIILWQSLKNLRSMGNAMDNLGELYLWQGKWQEAMNVFQEALIHLQPIKDELTVVRIYTMLQEHLNQASQQLYSK